MIYDANDYISNYRAGKKSFEKWMLSKGLNNIFYVKFKTNDRKFASKTKYDIISDVQDRSKNIGILDLYGPEFLNNCGSVIAVYLEGKLEKYPDIKLKYSSHDVEIQSEKIDSVDFDDKNLIEWPNNNQRVSENDFSDILSVIFPGEEIIKNQRIPGCKGPWKANYRIESQKLILEYDSPRHYSSLKCIVQDQEIDAELESLGYKVIHWPYWLQPSRSAIRDLFGNRLGEKILLNDWTSWKQGFESKNIVLPANFCSLGLKRFREEMLYFIYFLKCLIVFGVKFSEQVIWNKS